LKVINGAAEITLEGGNEKCTDDACHGGGQQEKPKIAEQALRRMTRNIELNPLCDEWPLKGVRRSGD
jgi:hypothetical protein